MIIAPLKGAQQSIENGHSNRLGSKLIDVMLHNAERLKKHINQMLNLSKLDAGSVQLTVRKHNFISFLKNTTQNFKIYAQEKNISIHLNLNVPPIYLYYDEEKMEQILSNLLSNAIKYSKENGTIILSVSENEQEVILQVKDNGIGIRSENISKIFDRYYRESEDKEIYGTGIGLSIVQHLADLHKAKISVSSQVGELTIFTLNIKKGQAHFKHKELTKTVEGSDNTKYNPEAIGLSTSQEKLVEEELPVILLVEDLSLIHISEPTRPY